MGNCMEMREAEALPHAPGGVPRMGEGESHPW